MKKHQMYRQLKVIYLQYMWIFDNYDSTLILTGMVTEYVIYLCFDHSDSNWHGIIQNWLFMQLHKI